MRVRKIFHGIVIFCLLAATAEARPRLVVLLVIDQFRADYLEKFRGDFVAGGFARLLKGAVFANTNYDYSGTETSPGHASISTGAMPVAHGIVGNIWYDRELRRTVTSIEDAAHKTVGAQTKNPAGSPHYMIGTGLADEIRLAFHGEAVAVSIKARGSILTGGKHPTAVFWFDDPGTERAVSSTYYMDKLPAWVEEFNQKYALTQHVGKEWRALNAHPDEPVLAVISKPGTSGGGPASSPFANESTVELARRSVVEYKLGVDQNTDFLSISLSANDYVGHNYGPDSRQMADMIRRTDRLLADFFTFLDKSVGANNWVIAFTADHGAAPVPEKLKEMRIDAGRIQAKDVLDPIEKALRAAYGNTADEKWVVAEDLPNVFLNYDLTAKYRTTVEEAARHACDALGAVRGIQACFTLGQLAARRADGNLVAHRAANSYYPGRGGDLEVIFSPFWIRDWPNLAANHGTPFSYDTHVPLIFMGPGFKPGMYQTAASPTDLAVTLAAMLGINPPAVATGKVLDVALMPRSEERGTRNEPVKKK